MSFPYPVLQCVVSIEVGGSCKSFCTHRVSVLSSFCFWLHVFFVVTQVFLFVCYTFHILEYYSQSGTNLLKHCIFCPPPLFCRCDNGCDEIIARLSDEMLEEQVKRLVIWNMEKERCACISEMTRKQMRGRWHLDGFKFLGIDEISQYDPTTSNNPSVLKPWLFGWHILRLPLQSFLPARWTSLPSRLTWHGQELAGTALIQGETPQAGKVSLIQGESWLYTWRMMPGLVGGYCNTSPPI